MRVAGDVRQRATCSAECGVGLTGREFNSHHSVFDAVTATRTHTLSARPWARIALEGVKWGGRLSMLQRGNAFKAAHGNRTHRDHQLEGSNGGQIHKRPRMTLRLRVCGGRSGPKSMLGGRLHLHSRSFLYLTAATPATVPGIGRLAMWKPRQAEQCRMLGGRKGSSDNPYDNVTPPNKAICTIEWLSLHWPKGGHIGPL